MDRFKISIATDFSRTPGPRFEEQGPYSAETFMRTVLRPKFEAALESNEVLYIDLDGTSGYATSFLEGSFGELQRNFPNIDISKLIRFTSNDDEFLVEEINEYVDDAKNQE